MANWIKCTQSNGEPIYVNLANAVSVKADGKGRSWIAFMSGEKEHIIVAETPEAVMRLAREAN